MKKRIIWLDYVRALAIFLVVLTHALEGVYALSAEAVLANSTISKLFLFNVMNLTRHGVPLFLMISGYLLLSRNYALSKPKDLSDGAKIYTCCDFWKKNLLNLFITVEIWIVLYNLYFVILDRRPFDFVKLIRQMLLIDSLELSHEWYIYMILGVYIFLPFVAHILNNIDLKYLILPISITVLVCMVLPTLTTVFSAYEGVWNVEVLGSPSVYSRMNLYYSGGSYGIYLICGYLSKKQVFSKIKIRYLILISIICFSAGTAFQWKSYLLGHPYLIWYDFFTLLPTSIAVFEIFSRIKLNSGWLYNVVNGISKASFGIYLMHNLVLIVLFRCLPLNIKLPIKVSVYCLIAFFTSWLVIWIISKIPKIGKYISFI